MADLDGPMERLSLRGGRVQRGGGGGRVMGGWSDHRGGGRGLSSRGSGRGEPFSGGRGCGLGRGESGGRGGSWWRGGSGSEQQLAEDDLRHRLNQPAEDLRVKLNANVSRDDFDDPYTADRREKLLGRDARYGISPSVSLNRV